MKRIKLVFITGILIVFYGSAIFAQQSGKRYGFSIGFGTAFSATGKYNTGYKLNKMTGMGINFSAGIYIRISDNYDVEMILDRMKMGYNEGYKPSGAPDPAFVISSITFNNHYGVFTGKVSPFFIVGLGIYNWKFSEDGFSGDPLTFEGEKVRKMSIGLNAGLGLKVRISENLEILGKVKYHYIFCRDEFFFGKDFSEQGVININCGIKVNFNSIF